MQLLKVPLTSDAMHHSLSLTGVSLLKQNEYKSRHSMPGRFVQCPKNGIILKPKDNEKKTQKRNFKKAPALTNSGEAKTARKSSGFVIQKKQVSHRINNYVLQMKGEKLLFFWTITFPLKTSDPTAYILLNKWLTRLRQEKMLKDYLWVAERQENGTIHFHMVVNNRMCVKKANKFMRASIMHCINQGIINYDRIAAMRYNGIDIAKDRKTKRVVNFAKKDKQKSLSRYLIKYVTKNNTVFARLAWHCSRGYSNLVIAVRLTESEFIVAGISSWINAEKLFENEWVIFYKWKSHPPPSFVKYLADVNHHINSKFN